MGGTITGLEVQQHNKERVNVYLDGTFAFGLTVLEAARLRKGQYLTDSEIASLKGQDLVERAYDRAIRFLGQRPRSTEEIRRHLSQKSERKDAPKPGARSKGRGKRAGGGFRNSRAGAGGRSSRSRQYATDDDYDSDGEPDFDAEEDEAYGDSPITRLGSRTGNPTGRSMPVSAASAPLPDAENDSGTELEIDNEAAQAAAIEDAILRLEAQGYLDDTAFARYWISNRQQFRPRGARALRFELREKGIQQNTIDEVLADFDTSESAYHAAQDKARRLWGPDRRVFREKLGSFLMRRGYDYDTVREVIDRLISEYEDAQQDQDQNENQDENAGG